MIGAVIPSGKPHFVRSPPRWPEKSEASASFFHHFWLVELKNPQSSTHFWHWIDKIFPESRGKSKNKKWTVSEGNHRQSLKFETWSDCRFLGAKRRLLVISLHYSIPLLLSGRLATRLWNRYLNPVLCTWARRIDPCPNPMFWFSQSPCLGDSTPVSSNPPSCLQ